MRNTKEPAPPPRLCGNVTALCITGDIFGKVCVELCVEQVCVEQVCVEHVCVEQVCVEQVCVQVCVEQVC